MLKRIFLSVVIILTISSLSCFADRNYLLETTSNAGNNTISSPIKSNQKHANGFCSSFSMGFSDVVNPKSGTVANGISNARGIFTDPYMIEIDGIRYMMIKDNNDGIFDKEDILGYKDTITNVFSSLRPLDKNNDEKLTGEELITGGIRFVRISPDGKLLYKNKEFDFDIKNIQFIYIKELRKAYKNDGSKGDFGLFDVFINNNGKSKLATGIVSFESEEQILNYF